MKSHSLLGTAFPWTDGPVNASTGIYGEEQQCQPGQPATAKNCQWWQVAPAWNLELVHNHLAAGFGYADSTSNAIGVVGNQDYGGWPLPNVSGPLARGYVPFGSLTSMIVVRGNEVSHFIFHTQNHLALFSVLTCC